MWRQNAMESWLKHINKTKTRSRWICSSLIKLIWELSVIPGTFFGLLTPKWKGNADWSVISPHFYCMRKSRPTSGCGYIALLATEDNASCVEERELNVPACWFHLLILLLPELFFIYIKKSRYIAPIWIDLQDMMKRFIKVTVLSCVLIYVGWWSQKHWSRAREG